ncbi:hypothetical protein SAMN05216498_2048 [Tenuibacillus multivorans]|uniref:Uncharacterized protein n=1 Tax=Tenuibacillus multivorans TaxID=237069 RepID=A0A1H0ARL3_9BACI|nr:hypothetical protein SAMN05216498_2048 [Tenuibacillus multivorans]
MKEKLIRVGTNVEMSSTWYEEKLGAQINYRVV